MGYMGTGRAILSGILSGIGGGLEGANNSLIERRKAAAKVLEDANQKSNLEREYNFINGLSDEDQQRAIAIKSAGQLVADPKTGKLIRKVNPKTGKTKEARTL